MKKLLLKKPIQSLRWADRFKCYESGTANWSCYSWYTLNLWVMSHPRLPKGVPRRGKSQPPGCLSYQPASETWEQLARQGHFVEETPSGEEWHRDLPSPHRSDFSAPQCKWETLPVELWWQTLNVTSKVPKPTTALSAAETVTLEHYAGHATASGGARLSVIGPLFKITCTYRTKFSQNNVLTFVGALAGVHRTLSRGCGI